MTSEPPLTYCSSNASYHENELIRLAAPTPESPECVIGENIDNYSSRNVR